MMIRLFALFLVAIASLTLTAPAHAIPDAADRAEMQNLWHVHSNLVQAQRESAFALKDGQDVALYGPAMFNILSAMNELSIVMTTRVGGNAEAAFSPPVETSSDPNANTRAHRNQLAAFHLPRVFNFVQAAQAALAPGTGSWTGRVRGIWLKQAVDLKPKITLSAKWLDPCPTADCKLVAVHGRVPVGQWNGWRGWKYHIEHQLATLAAYPSPKIDWYTQFLTGADNNLGLALAIPIGALIDVTDAQRKITADLAKLPHGAFGAPFWQVLTYMDRATNFSNVQSQPELYHRLQVSIAGADATPDIMHARARITDSWRHQAKMVWEYGFEFPGCAPMANNPAGCAASLPSQRVEVDVATEIVGDVTRVTATARSSQTEATKVVDVAPKVVEKPIDRPVATLPDEFTLSLGGTPSVYRRQ